MSSSAPHITQQAARDTLEQYTWLLAFLAEATPAMAGMSDKAAAGLGFLLGQYAGHVALGGGLGHGGQGAASSVMFSTRATRS